MHASVQAEQRLRLAGRAAGEERSCSCTSAVLSSRCCAFQGALVWDLLYAVKPLRQRRRAAPPRARPRWSW